MGSFLQRYRAFVVLAFILLYALAQIFSIGLKDRYELNTLERVIVTITAPPQQFFSYVIDKTHGLWLGYVYLVNTEKNYRRIVEKNRELAMKIAALEEEQQENDRLRGMLGFKQKVPYKLVPARVISFGNSSFSHDIRIDKGSADGIRPQLAVVTSDGVVGHVINTTQNYANVLLLIDPKSSVDVLNQKTRARGILEGQGTYQLKLKFLVEQESIDKGEILVTSGLDTLYAKGLTVGRVIEAKKNPASLFIDVTVEPSVNFARLEEVFVLTNPTAAQLAAKEIAEP